MQGFDVVEAIALGIEVDRSQMTEEERREYDYYNRTPMRMRDSNTRLRKNPESKWYVYAMALLPHDVDRENLTRENANYYVGLTTNVEARFEKHQRNPTNVFVKKHDPVKILWSKCYGDDQEAALKKEDGMTLQLMKKYGINRVRGGKYYKYNLPEEQIEEIRRLIN